MRNFHPWPIFPYDLESPAMKSLALLLILQELLLSLETLEIAKSNIPSTQGEIEKQLEQYILFSLSNPFTKNGGCIDRLCFYSENLLQASKINDNRILMILEEMRNAILDLKAKLGVKKQSPLQKQIIPLLSQLYDHLYQKFSDFFSTLFDFLKESRTNENILVYILEHREQFNLLFGPKTIENLLCRLFPSGPCELRAAICEGYTRRGFTDFYAKQEPLLDAIEWEAPSCPPCID